MSTNLIRQPNRSFVDSYNFLTFDCESWLPAPAPCWKWPNSANTIRIWPFYLSTMVIQTTSLAERLEDIPMLAQAFIEERNAHHSRQFGGCSKSALELLAQCRWPRNLDQLKQAVLEACQNAQGPEIQAADFSESIQQRAKATRYETGTELKIDLDAYLESIERELIVRALNQGKQNKSKAAKLLGINRAKLLRRLAHFDLNTRANSDQEGRVDSSAFLEAADENEASL